QSESSIPKRKQVLNLVTYVTTFST
ncbi:hypothetical protein VCHENC02_5601, partial [Vibrio harveyi]